jgi:hypothetical protein
MSDYEIWNPGANPTNTSYLARFLKKILETRWPTTALALYVVVNSKVVHRIGSRCSVL